MDCQELENSIIQYEEQLLQVELAIASATGDDRISLLSLREDINQLLSLTKENLAVANLSVGDNSDVACSSVNSLEAATSNSVDDEYAMFMAEMVQSGAIDTQASTITDNTSNITDELKTLEGMKCQAPYEHEVEGIMFHNALVFGVESNEDKLFENIKVRVMFTNPTHQEMLPCPYFLESDCKFSEDKCRYSHGEVVPLASLREYKEPNFDSIKLGARVLAKHPKRKLWQMAIIKSVEKDQLCILQFENNKETMELNFEDILPLDDCESSDSESTDSDMDDVQLIEQSLTTTPTSQALGSWEKHTKGFGSKMLQKLGYVIGTGLGRKSDGRVDPVEVLVLPQGKSLDYCMTLRENAGGDENFFKVEKKMQRLQKKQEERNKRVYERQKAKTDVFSFLNETLGTKEIPLSKTASEAGFSKTVHRRDLKAESSRDLNISSLKIEEDIRRVERVLHQLNESLARHTDDKSAVRKNLRIQLLTKERELRNLRTCERNVQCEQSLRKDKKKLTIF